ncbi:hypothetical protein GFS60_07033 (plasmid) [Rhodococcus sp. WAY2]|nr:hypothetical protein GFS60_07033 [Rhodococcus sp. WAY2]
MVHHRMMVDRARCRVMDSGMEKNELLSIPGKRPRQIGCA